MRSNEQLHVLVLPKAQAQLCSLGLGWGSMLNTWHQLWVCWSLPETGKELPLLSPPCAVISAKL